MTKSCGNETPVFVVSFVCRNCSRQWKENFYKGDEVSNSIQGIKVKDRRCDGHISCKFCRTIKCPNCDCENVAEGKRCVYG